jgi:hypothetical protein
MRGVCVAGPVETFDRSLFPKLNYPIRDLAAFDADLHLNCDSGGENLLEPLSVFGRVAQTVYFLTKNRTLGKFWRAL